MNSEMYRNLVNISRVQLSIYRNYSSEVRVRFAPSPTGFLHLGGLRTALYNYLFARSKKGTFIVRIEDTDKSRQVPGSVEQLLDDLHWSGIIPDEDPIRGGPAGPYLQSKRLELYKEQVEVLLRNGSAYRCFCSQRRLEMLRKDAVQARVIPKYDNRCKNLSDEEVQNNLSGDRPFCIRFKLIPTPEPFKDLIYGDIAYDVAQNEGDPVVMKSDGFPTYHFANVVDDHFMKISHVLRGVEWQISTPKHLLLYKAFGWEPPQFGHLPLILNSDGSKLSKRQNDIRVDFFKKDGIYPLALVNYITSAGGGFVREQGEQRCYSYYDLIQQFDIGKINSHSSKLMPPKLLEFNKLELSNLLANEDNHKFLIERVVQMVKETFPDRVSDGTLNLDNEHIIATLKWAQTRITRLSDLFSKDFKFLWIKPAVRRDSQVLKYLKFIESLSMKLESMDSSDFSKDSLRVQLKEFTATNNIPFPDFMMILRWILSGLKDGPAVIEIMEILGKDVTVDRLKQNFTNN